MQIPHAFRWIDHIQHLPGMIEQVESLGLFVSFPNEKAEPPSKAELARLAKEQWKKDKKAGLIKDQAEEKKVQSNDQSKKQKGKEESKTEKPSGDAPAKDKKQKQKPPAPKKSEEPDMPDICKLDIQVGKIIEVQKNPDSDTIYMEKIDMGNGRVRNISSGL